MNTCTNYGIVGIFGSPQERCSQKNKQLDEPTKCSKTHIIKPK
jgi:hypothetical protein